MGSMAMATAGGRRLPQLYQLTANPSSSYRPGLLGCWRCTRT